MSEKWALIILGTFFHAKTERLGGLIFASSSILLYSTLLCLFQLRLVYLFCLSFCPASVLLSLSLLCFGHLFCLSFITAHFLYSIFLSCLTTSTYLYRTSSLIHLSSIFYEITYGPEGHTNKQSLMSFAAKCTQLRCRDLSKMQVWGLPRIGALKIAESVARPRG